LCAEFAKNIGVTQKECEEPHRWLSDREFQVLLLIANGNSVNDIAEQLHMSINTVYTHRRHLMEKMQLSSNAQLVHYALERRLIE